MLEAGEMEIRYEKPPNQPVTFRFNVLKIDIFRPCFYNPLMYRLYNPTDTSTELIVRKNRNTTKKPLLYSTTKWPYLRTELRRPKQSPVPIRLYDQHLTLFH